MLYATAALAERPFTCPEKCFKKQTLCEFKIRKDSEALWTDGTDTLPCTAIGSVIGTHAGPGAVAVAFFKKH